MPAYCDHRVIQRLDHEVYAVWYQWNPRTEEFDDEVERTYEGETDEPSWYRCADCGAEMFLTD